MRLLPLVGFVVALGCSSAPTAPPLPNDAADVTTDLAVAPDDVPSDASTDVTTDAPPDAADVTLDAARDDGHDASSDDASDAADTPADVNIDPGVCGPGVRRCFCGCGANASCQNGCIARDIDCGGCLYLAATRCCPDASTLLDECIDVNRCPDDACIRANCATQLASFEGCFAMRQNSVEFCRAEVRTCLGSDYPMIRCVMK